MKTPYNGLKSEKITFIVVICIMLFSLIYMSSYSLLMKNKIELFQKDLQAITGEMNVLLKYLPEKDSLIQQQKEKIIDQMQAVQAAIAKNQTSEEERKKLIIRLSELKDEVEKLSLEAKDKITTVTVIQQTAAQPEVHLPSPKKDPLLQAKEVEIASLKATIAELQAKQPAVILQNKLSMYYFTAVSSDKRYRASRTENLRMKFQLKGDVDNLYDKYLYLEIRDPYHRIISSPRDKVRISKHFVSEYVFEPVNYQFVKGKYSVKIYSEEAMFQSIYFLTLN
jgi:hypothetical protein